MERLTYFENGKWRMDFNGCQYQANFVDRLAAYEDTGLTPGEINSMQEEHFSGLEMAKLHRALMKLKKYQEADRDDRLVVLPCKVGDVVYGFYGEKTILPMVAKWIETNTDGWCIAVQYVPMAPRFYRFSDFGKTVFLTREEAEAALKEVQNGNKTDM